MTYQKIASLVVIVTEGSHLSVFLRHLDLDLVKHFQETIIVNLASPDNNLLKPLEDKCSIINANPKDYKHLFYYDDASSFPSGIFNWKGPFSSLHKIVDWSKVRNLGFSRCSQEYRVTVYEDEIIDHPEHVLKLIDLMREKQSEVAYTRRLSPHEDGYVPRISKNDPCITWFGSVDESIDGVTKFLISSEHLQTRVFFNSERSFDKFTSCYANALKEEWNIYPRDLINLAKYSVPLFGFLNAEKLLTDYLDISLHTEERAWACAVYGEMLEKAGYLEPAAAWYRRSMGEHPGWKSAIRLCRILFQQQKWEEVLDAFSEAVQNKDEPHIIDNGNESIEKMLVLVAECNYRLGNKQDAVENCHVLRTLFPLNDKIKVFCNRIEK